MIYNIIRNNYNYFINLFKKNLLLQLHWVLYAYLFLFHNEFELRLIIQLFFLYIHFLIFEFYSLSQIFLFLNYHILYLLGHHYLLHHYYYLHFLHYLLLQINIHEKLLLYLLLLKNIIRNDILFIYIFTFPFRRIRIKFKC